MPGSGARGCGRCSSISEILEQRGAGRARCGRGHARRRRRSRSARSTPRRTGSPTRSRGRSGSARGDRVLWWGDTSLEAIPVFARPGQDRRGVRAAERRGRRSRRSRPSPSTRRARLLLAGSSHTASRRPNSPRSTRHSVPRGSTRQRRAASTGLASRRRRRARSARHLLHQRQHGAAQGRRALAPRELAAHVSSARPRAPGGGGTVCMFPLFHMAGWTIALGAWQGAAAGALRAGPRRRRRSARRPRPAIARRGSTASPRSGRACWSTAWRGYDLVGARRGRHRHVGHTAGAARRDQGRAAADRDARVLRIDRGGTRRALGRRRPARASPEASACRSRASRCGSTSAARCALRSPFLMDGYFDDPEATAEALRRRLVPHGRSRRARRRRLPVDRRPRPRRDPHRRRDGRAARGRSGARRPSRHRRSRGGRRARRRSGARSSPRSSSCAPGGAPCPTSTRSGRSARAGSRRSSSPAASRSSTRSPAPPPPARSSAPSSSNASRRPSEQPEPAVASMRATPVVDRSGCGRE